MISIDIKNSGAGNETPPPVGMCSTGQVALMAPYAAPWSGTRLPVAGTATSVRLRGLIAAAGTTGTTTGAFLGATVRPSVQITAQQEFAVAGVPAGHASNTPGDLPPEDPLS
ncbi:MAG: hypothetical protein JWP68_2448 [Modestobacter sp.]|nr:hypothetical protein [Modestobacter sp.]MCW2509300.1 hypothetical protein [Modestobacter sp.]